MGSITTLRPSSTSSGVGWSAQPGGTLHGVTSDNSDASYALWSGSGPAMVLATPVDAPPAGERRHQVRVRARGEDGDAWWAVRLASGTLVAGAAAQYGASPETVAGSWGFGVPADGSVVLYAYVTGQSDSVKINELYLDVDSREAPTFTAQVLDASGTPTTLVADTTQPTMRVNAVDLDGLNARQYRYWVTRSGAVVWDTGIVPGTAANRQTVALDNDEYVAHFQVWSTLGDATAYPSAEAAIDFTISVGTVERPDNPTVQQVEGTPFYEIEACAPDIEVLDGETGWIEVQRVDCPVGGYLTSSGTPGSYASTSDPGTAVTNLQLTIKAGRDDGWWSHIEETLAAKYDTGSNQRSWRLSIGGETGLPLLGWSQDGTSALEFAQATHRPLIDPFGVMRLRVLLDVDDGLGTWTVVYQSRETDDDEWSQLGEVLTGTSGTPLFDSSAPYTVGAFLTNGSPNAMFSGRIYEVEVRDGPAGPVVVSPDFTYHLDGTRNFTDTQGNEWTINGSALIYSPTRTVTVAVLGPLTTGECASWVDFTLPRTGVGRSCDHEPVACCSYYRARTIGRRDGDLRVSNWSDTYDPGIAEGTIVMWPFTDASIPAGWERVQPLDGRYPKGVPDASTLPGSTGGAVSHTHILPSHTHDTSHLHTVTGGNTGVAVGSASTGDGGAGTALVLASHTHSRSSTGTATVVSGAATPTTSAVANDPARLEVIFVESDGTPTEVPDGALGLMPDISVSGWTTYAAGNQRFLKGAAPGADGGTTAASSVDSHTHMIEAHTHTGTSHSHTSPNTGTASATRALVAGAVSVSSQASHSHLVTVNNANTAALSSATGGSSGASGTLNPPYRNLRLNQKGSGGIGLPVGLICLWRYSPDSVPEKWQVCDGTNGTPDMFGRYPRASVNNLGDAGGSLNPHSHTSGTHNHGTSGHTHTESVAAAGTTAGSGSATATLTVATTTHTHSAGATDSTTPTVAQTGSGTLDNTTSEPPYGEVVFMQLMEEPGPPPDPDVFCLDWSQDEHLLRSYGPDGPMWAPVLGKFDWSVTRPFTDSTGVMGSRFVTSAEPGGRNFTMTAAVESEAELTRLRSLLNRPLVLVSPSDSTELWAAPVASTVRVIKIGRIRQVTATFIGTGPQPAPQLADVEV